MTIKADPRVKQLWLDALRSGEYSQAIGYLQTPEGHCCLGVLCDVAVKEGVIPPLKVNDPLAPMYYFHEDDAHGRVDGQLPVPVAQWLFGGASGSGLSYDVDPEVPVPVEELDPEVQHQAGEIHISPLSELNDTFFFDFNQIADVIEAQL